MKQDRTTPGTKLLLKECEIASLSYDDFRSKKGVPLKPAFLQNQSNKKISICPDNRLRAMTKNL